MTLPTRRPPVDPEIARALEEFSDIVVTGLSPDQLLGIRALGTDPALPELTRHGAFERSETTVPRDDAPAVPVVIYRPVDRESPVPVIVYLHGGGLVAGTPESDMPAIAELADAVGCAVVSVGYRLAPEHPYPAALDDAVAVVRWLGCGECPEGIDAQRIVLAGVSAGGGLAAATALYLRDHEGLRLTALMLACPMLDHRSDTFSARQMVGAGSWDATANAAAWGAYLGSDVTEAAPSAYASAALADDLSGLPPTFIDVGSAETFRDECVAFAGGIWRDGGDAELHVWPGGVHAFDFLAPWAALSRAARAERVTWLSRVLARS